MCSKCIVARPAKVPANEASVYREIEVFFMRLGFLALLSIAPYAIAQTASIAPIPPDPLELVTGQTQIPASPQQRAAVVTLMGNALANHNLHVRGDNPFDIRVSFNAAASTLYPAGQGTLEESWVSGQHWRWTATMGDYSQLQIGSNSAVYGQNRAVMPMRVQALREALFAPLPGNGSRLTLRSSSVLLNGTPLTCVLTSSGANRQVPANGRQWYENEYCIDPATSTLRISSIAPGMYVAYDYANGHRFHDHLLPGKITITESGSTVLEAQISSVTDADPSNLTIYTPTAQMTAQGAAPVIEMPERFPRFFAAPAGSPSTVQPVIVHATLSQGGKILEIEALQSNAYTAAALRMVMQETFGGRPLPAGASPHLREAFINVQFRPLQN